MKTLIDETEEWEPDDSDDLEMPSFIIDDVEMPKFKSPRLQKYEQIKKKYDDALKRLQEDTPYKAKSSLF